MFLDRTVITWRIKQARQIVVYINQ